MIINSSVSMVPTQPVDSRIEKTIAIEEAKAIEDSGKGYDSTVYNNNQNIENNQVVKDIMQRADIERETNKVQGETAKELSSGNYTNNNQCIIDVLA